MVHESIDKTLKAADSILSQFDLARRAEAAILRGPCEDLESYLEVVDLLKGIVHFFSSNKNFKSSEGVLNHVNNRLAKSALKIEEEFRQLMTNLLNPIASLIVFPSLCGHQGMTLRLIERMLAILSIHPKAWRLIYKTPTLIPPRILSLMNDIARQLVQAGNQQSCCKIYRDSRGSALEMSLRKLGVEKLSKEDVQKMQWEALEAKIEVMRELQYEVFWKLFIEACLPNV